MGIRYNAYDLAIYDELGPQVGTRVTDGTVTIEVRVGGVKATSGNGALATLFSDPEGNTSLTNPITGTSFGDRDRVQFFTTSDPVDIIVRDYGDRSLASYPMRFGRYGVLWGVTPRSQYKTVVLPAQQGLRIVKIPFSATGVDADDVPESWDNAEASCVIANNSATTIRLCKGFCVTGFAVEVRTADATETFDLGLLSSQTGGDADGFLDGVSLGTAGWVYPGPTITAGSNENYVSDATLGAYMRYADGFLAGANTATDEGSFYPRIYMSDTNAADTVSITGSAGIDTAEGDIYMFGYIIPSSFVTA